MNFRSTHCFIDSKFVNTHHLKTSATPPVALHSFDSSSNSIISEITILFIILPTSDCINLDFYVTLLDSSCSLILEYNWLTQQNSLIDQINELINFYSSLQKNLAPSYIMINILLVSPSASDISLQSSDPMGSIFAFETFVFLSEQPNITIISTAAFLCTLKLPGSSNFELCFCSSDIQTNSTKLEKASDLSNVFSEYYKFTNIFRKTKAEVFTPYCSYDLQINLKEGSQLLVGPIYSLSVFKQEALKKFIEKNLNMGFIQPTSSLHNAPVLFIKKKDGSLHLCINFCDLNCISKKNCYPLPLISDLLDSPYKAQVYSKINLYYAYHLVHITNGDKWKTAFRTCYRSFKQSVIPFSLTNTSVAFQQFMNDIFSNLLDICVIIYLDDILIYSNNMSEHHQHVKEVLKCLCKADLYTKTEKCKFHSKLVEYLGYILSSSSLIMSDNKIKII